MINEPQKVVLLGESCADKTDIIAQYSMGTCEPEKKNL